MALQDLQAIIDKRATDRLKKDINALIMTIYSSKLTGTLKTFLPKENTPGEFRLVEFNYLLQYDSNLGKQIFNDNIGRYIAEEAANFVNKVDQIKDQVDELYDITSNLENR